MKKGYCCNVHGGTTLDEVKSNLQRYACRVKEYVSPDAKMPVGLWLSQSAIEDLGDHSPSAIQATREFGDWLAEKGLDPFTFNGFPLGDFHQDVVKHDVYLPTWAEKSRLQYTQKLATVQTMLLQHLGFTPGFQTISTLPLGWPPVAKERLFADGKDFLRQCAANLHTLARYLAELKKSQGNEVVVCIEPEPGCVFDTCDDIVRFFHEYLLDGDSAVIDQTLEHIGICHDICHSAVMFEDQLTAVQAYADAGIRIGKVQVSSAIEVQFDGDPETDSTKLRQLSQFSEPKYLHQTTIRNGDSGEFEFFEDLSLALSRQPAAGEQWRVHFHVPVFAERLGDLATSQKDIHAFMEAISQTDSAPQHFEVETYAWNVLPEEYRNIAGDLASGIAHELKWFSENVS